MNDIEVGEYVRTKGQGIKQIDFIFENKTVNKYGYKCGSDWDGIWYSYIKTTDIISHSKNIIDLIEVGDYVNGYKVLNITGIDGIENKAFTIFNDEQTDFIKVWKEQDIKSILTKEQFKEGEYVVE